MIRSSEGMNILVEELNSISSGFYYLFYLLFTVVLDGTKVGLGERQMLAKKNN